MKKRSTILFACVLWLVAPWALAGNDTSDALIDSLLGRVEASSCQFVRNGSAYSGKEAAAHLRQKRGIAQRSLGAGLTPDLFIERVASRSEISGRPYLIDCAGASRPLAGWLQEQLHELQAAAGSKDRLPATPPVP